MATKSVLQEAYWFSIKGKMQKAFGIKRYLNIKYRKESNNSVFKNKLKCTGLTFKRK